MVDFTYSDLIGQRGTLTTAIAEQNEIASGLREKISRLEKAISSMGNYITNIEDVKGKFDELTIDENRWKGTEKNKFDEQFQSLKDNTDKYLETTRDGKTTMEEELERLEAELARVEATIARFETSLSNVNAQISARNGG